MEVRVHLHSERRRKRLAILGSKEPHCLQQLVLRGQLTQEFALPDTSQAAVPPRAHEGSKQDTK